MVGFRQGLGPDLLGGERGGFRRGLAVLLILGGRNRDRRSGVGPDGRNTDFLEHARTSVNPLARFDRAAHVLNRGGRGGRSPSDVMARRPDER